MRMMRKRLKIHKRMAREEGDWVSDIGRGAGMLGMGRGSGGLVGMRMVFEPRGKGRIQLEISVDLLSCGGF